MPAEEQKVVPQEQKEQKRSIGAHIKEFVEPILKLPNILKEKKWPSAHHGLVELAKPSKDQQNTAQEQVQPSPLEQQHSYIEELREKKANLIDALRDDHGLAYDVEDALRRKNYSLQDLSEELLAKHDERVDRILTLHKKEVKATIRERELKLQSLIETSCAQINFDQFSPPVHEKAASRLDNLLYLIYLRQDVQNRGAILSPDDVQFLLEDLEEKVSEFKASGFLLPEKQSANEQESEISGNMVEKKVYELREKFSDREKLQDMDRIFAIYRLSKPYVSLTNIMEVINQMDMGLLREEDSIGVQMVNSFVDYASHSMNFMVNPREELALDGQTGFINSEESIDPALVGEVLDFLQVVPESLLVGTNFLLQKTAEKREAYSAVSHEFEAAGYDPINSDKNNPQALISFNIDQLSLQPPENQSKYIKNKIGHELSHHSHCMISYEVLKKVEEQRVKRLEKKSLAVQDDLEESDLSDLTAYVELSSLENPSLGTIEDFAEQGALYLEDPLLLSIIDRERFDEMLELYAGETDDPEEYRKQELERITVEEDGILQQDEWQIRMAQQGLTPEALRTLYHAERLRGFREKYDSERKFFQDNIKNPPDASVTI